MISLMTLKEYDQGLLEGISALEDLNAILDKKVTQQEDYSAEQRIIIIKPAARLDEH